jgi:hypothetical protein
MKLFDLTSILSLSAVTLVTTLLSSKPAFSQPTTFTCGTNAGSPATIVKTAQHGDVTIITWDSGFFQDSGFDNKTRCDMVTKKFQSLYDQGSLKYFTAGTASKQPIICAVPSMDSPCNSDSQLFTLKPDSNAEETLQKLFGVRRGASSESLNENENPSASERTYLDFEAFLQDKADQTNPEQTSAQQETTSTEKPSTEESVEENQEAAPGGTIF